MRIPFVGGYSEVRSAVADLQRSVNCYLEVDPKNGRAPIALYGTPGLTLRVTLPTAPVRWGIKFNDTYSYWVAGNTVYRVDGSYVVTTLGTIGTSTGPVGMASNGTEVLIVDGLSGWLATGGSLAQVVDVDFPNGVTHAEYQDSFFLVAGDGSGRLYWNETPNTGTAWNGLDFVTAETNPDNTVAIISDHREVWAMGTESGELFVNTGNADALFQRSGNASLEVGCGASRSLQAMNNTVYWLGSGRDGHGIVFKAEGYTPRRISNHALERAIAGYSTISDAVAYTYQIQGHSFYVLSFPTGNATWFYDAASEEWFEWIWRDPSDNSENRHRGGCCVFFGGRHLVGDWETGDIYSLEMDVYTDNGDPIIRKRVTQSLSEDGRRLFFESLQIDMEVGVGLATGQGSDPQVMLRYTNDGHTWSNLRTRSIGAAGRYKTRVKFGPTGAGHNRAWELTMSDPVEFAVFGAWASITKGD